MSKASSDQNAPCGAILGAGAQGRVVAAVWRRAEPNRKLVFLDDNVKLHGTLIAGIPVLGEMGLLGTPACQASVCIVAVGDNQRRQDLAKLIPDGISLIAVIDPSAVIMPDSTIGQGTFVGPRAVIHMQARIGENVIVNSGSLVEHDCVVEDAVSISPGVCMAGRTHIGRRAFLGVGAVLVGRVRVGNDAIVGAGSVVTTDVPAGKLVYGNPARVIRDATPRDWQRVL